MAARKPRTPVPEILDSCVRKVYAKKGSWPAAWAICTASLQRAGILKVGTRTLTAKGRAVQAQRDIERARSEAAFAAESKVRRAATSARKPRAAVKRPARAAPRRSPVARAAPRSHVARVVKRFYGLLPAED